MTESLSILIRERAGELPEARRGGYQREAVDDLLAELLAKLEEVETKPVSASSRRHVERMSEKMAELLDTAEENAAELLDDARREATQVVEQARAQASELLERAEADARTEREQAEQQAGDVRADAVAEAQRIREESERRAETQLSAARTSAQELVAAAEARRRELDAAVTKLEQRREEVVRILTHVARGLDSTVEELNARQGGNGAAPQGSLELEPAAE